MEWKPGKTPCTPNLQTPTLPSSRADLILLKPARAGGVETTIDIFFRHLAEDQDGKAVGIILSGMGNDGTLGIRALKEYTGMAMAQEPSTAKFGSMPQSAIATGLVDYIAPAEDLPLRLIDYVKTRSLLWQEQHPQDRDPGSGEYPRQDLRTHSLQDQPGLLPVQAKYRHAKNRAQDGPAPADPNG